MARKRDDLKQPGDAGSGLSKVQAHTTLRVLYTVLVCAPYYKVTLCAPHVDCHQRCSCRPCSHLRCRRWACAAPCLIGC
eukprot:scaffold28869_cov66-Phaeocystis_antarctica.AAC.5